MLVPEAIDIGWKKLCKILKEISKAINRNRPVKGDGIIINHTDTGCIISVEKKEDAEKTPDPSAGGRWTPVTIVDPATCAQSTLYVWALPK